MKKSKKIGLSLNKKVVSNLQSDAVKGGNHNSYLCTFNCTGTIECGPAFTQHVAGCTEK